MIKTYGVIKLATRSAALLGMATLATNPIFAQQKTLDPSGYVIKYDTQFDGIGPQVYVLPAPRTKEEEIRDNYMEIASFQDSIAQALQYLRLLEHWKPTTNNATVVQLTPTLKNTEEWNALIATYSDQQNHDIASGLLNEYAKIRILKHETSQAVSLLEAALKEATAQQNISDMGAIQSNLSTLLLYNKDYMEAGRYEEIYYKRAVESKSIVDQALSLVKIALIQAYDKDYNSAENNIIRKAVPLFNKAKAHEGKIIAWLTLAEIYQMQNKHTQAQWFLIQARDLASDKNFGNNLAEIEYMLASSKYIQENIAVSKKELLLARELAKQEDNKYLELAIVEKLGRINLQEDNMGEAEQQLKDYWKIRKALF